MCNSSARRCQHCGYFWPFDEPESICDKARKEGALCEPILKNLKEREYEPLCLYWAVEKAKAAAKKMSKKPWLDQARVARQHIEKWMGNCLPIPHLEPSPELASGSKAKQETDGDKRKGREVHGLGISIPAPKEAGDEEKSKKRKSKGEDQAAK